MLPEGGTRPERSWVGLTVLSIFRMTDPLYPHPPRLPDGTQGTPEHYSREAAGSL